MKVVRLIPKGNAVSSAQALARYDNMAKGREKRQLSAKIRGLVQTINGRRLR
jgi:hypothetical protein